MIEKQDKAREKAKSKNQSIGMRRLALSNSRAVELGTFKDIFSDPATAPLKSDETSTFSSNQLLDNDPTLGPVPKTPGTVDGLIAARLKSSEKKKAKGKTLSRRLSKEPGRKAPRVPTSSLVVMELIRPGKQRVRVPANLVESTPPKRMRQSSLN